MGVKVQMFADRELDTFKREVNLAEFAAAFGYLVDKKASSRNSVVMSHPNGDKVVIARDEDGHWIFFSVRDDKDNGSIIDFVQRRSGGTLGTVRKELRGWLSNRPAHSIRLGDQCLSPEPTSKNILRVRASFENTKVITQHPYLERERCIPAEVLAGPRFSGCVRTDARGNAIFPHLNELGLCGFEIKNKNFTGFSPGGEKGLWQSAALEADNSLVICESAIDALSHFALKCPERSRYVSIAGAMNPGQPELLRGAAKNISHILVATDNDEGGDRLTVAIQHALNSLASQMEILEDRPPLRETDWNDVLAAQRKGR